MFAPAQIVRPIRAVYAGGLALPALASNIYEVRSLSALNTTLTDEELIASAAMSGDSSSPNTGQSTPAARPLDGSIV